MFDTTTLKKLCRQLLGPAALIASLAAAGCIDNSGNKTYPRADATADAPVDAGEPETAEDAPADAPATETGSDSPADTVTDVPATDTGAGDVHADTASGG